MSQSSSISSSFSFSSSVSALASPVGLAVRDWSSLSPSEIAGWKSRLSPAVFSDSSHRYLIRTVRSSQNERERVRQLFVTGQCEYHFAGVEYINIQLERDMKDPYAEYVEKPGSNFWVVERVEDGALIACVAVHPVSKGDHFYYLQYIKKTMPIPPNHSTYSKSSSESNSSSSSPAHPNYESNIDEHPDIFDVIGSESELRRMVVDPCARGLNIAQRLLDVLCDFSRACGYVAVHLSTLFEMFPACRLYTGYGFEILHTESIKFDRKNLEWKNVKRYYPEYRIVKGRFENLIAQWEQNRKDKSKESKTLSLALSTVPTVSSYASSPNNLYAKMASPPNPFSLMPSDARPKEALSIVHPIVPEEIANNEDIYPKDLPEVSVKVQHFRRALV